MSSASKVFLITGANRGIGFAILQALALKAPENHCLLACRSASAGKEAISQLRELRIQASIDVVELDVTNDTSILAAKKFVEEKFGKLIEQC